jgi:transposase
MFAAPGARNVPVHRTHFCRWGIRGTQDGFDGVAHRRLEIAVGFEVLPKRTVERTFAWISRNHRLARDYERDATTVAALVRLA